MSAKKVQGKGYVPEDKKVVVNRDLLELTPEEKAMSMDFDDYVPLPDDEFQLMKKKLEQAAKNSIAKRKSKKIIGVNG